MERPADEELPDALFARVERQVEQRESKGRPRAGSRAPYMQRQLVVVPCVRRGRRGCCTQIRVAGDVWRPLCLECGTNLAAAVLAFLRDDQAALEVKSYGARLLMEELGLSSSPG